MCLFGFGSPCFEVCVYFFRFLYYYVPRTLDIAIEYLRRHGFLYSSASMRRSFHLFRFLCSYVPKTLGMAIEYLGRHRFLYSSASVRKFPFLQGNI